MALLRSDPGRSPRSPRPVMIEVALVLLSVRAACDGDSDGHGGSVRLEACGSDMVRGSVSGLSEESWQSWLERVFRTSGDLLT
jgi:hypothetical protein